MNGDTFSDYVAITNSATPDAKSAAQNMDITPNSTITEIKVASLTVGNTYAVEIEYPSGPSPLKFVVPSGGAPATNGQALHPTETIKVRIPVKGVSRIKVYTYADTASATCIVGIKWQAGLCSDSDITYGDFLTASIGTTETDGGDIPIPSGAVVRQIVVASRLSIGMIEYVRLDCSGIQTPQKYAVASYLYDAVGTQVQDNGGGIQPIKPIDVRVTVPASTNTMAIYALSQTASNTSALGLVWTK